MTNMPGVEHAILLCKENLELGVGIHLVLTTGKPVNKKVPSLVNEKGYFKGVKNWEETVDIEDIRKEFKSQIEKFLSFGFMPTHIDSHHHVHFNPKILPIVIDMAREYNLPIRFTKEDLNNNGFDDINSVEHFVGDFYGDGLTIEKFEEIIESNIKYESIDIMCHPAYVDQSLLSNSSYNIQRINELNILTSPEVFEIIKKHNIELINYKQL